MVAVCDAPSSSTPTHFCPLRTPCASKDIGVQVLRALNVMHKRQIVNLAVCAQNVMLKPVEGGTLVKLSHLYRAQAQPRKAVR